MEFLDFCRACGILIDHEPPIGVWKRYPTEDHPRKRNGAVKFMGDHAFVQNHATDTEVQLWRTDRPVKIDHAKIRAASQAAQLERERLQRNAASKAAQIIKESVRGFHDYIKAKGFEDEEVNIYFKDGIQHAVIPMRVDGRLVGCQLIDPKGGKKFLYGQRTNDAQFVLDNKGPHFFCEGYATALSLRAVLASMKLRYTIHVCFSAHNLLRVAQSLRSGVVIADNDKSGTGLKIAQQSLLPYWMSDRVGEDFNDFWRRVGAVRAGLALRPLVVRRRAVG